MTPANFLTILRVLMVPLFVLLVIYGKTVASLVVFLVAGITDLLDGVIARRFDQQSPLGAQLDPIADKLLLVTSFVVLSLPGLPLPNRLPAWLTITVISRDILLVAGAILVNLMLGRHIFPPSPWGKVTTFFQLASVFALLVVNASGLQVPLLPLYYATLALTVISGLHYLFRGTRLVDYDQSGEQ